MIFIDEDRAEFIAQQRLYRRVKRDSSRSKIDFPKVHHLGIQSFVSMVYASMDNTDYIEMRKKEELRAIDNYRWPLPYILFILQDSCTFVSVEFANRYPDSLSISLCTHHLAVCCVSRPSSKGEESGREGEYTRVRACFSERVVDAAPRRRHLRPHRFVPVARNNRV